MRMLLLEVCKASKEIVRYESPISDSVARPAQVRGAGKDPRRPRRNITGTAAPCQTSSPAVWTTCLPKQRLLRSHSGIAEM